MPLSSPPQPPLVAQRGAEVRELRDSDSRYWELFEANPQPMLVYDLETLKFLAVNEAAVVQYGYSRDEFDAMSILDIRPPEDVPRVLQRIADLRNEDDRPAGIWRHRRKDGTLIDVETTSNQFDLGGRRAQLVLANDVTDRMQAERKLRESEARFRSLTEMSSDFYWESDVEHRLTQHSSSSKDDVATALPYGSPLGTPRWELPYLTPDASGWRSHRAALDAHLPFRDFEFSRPRADGGVRHVSISGDPVFDASGAFRGYRGVGTNITERKRAQTALARSHDLYNLLSQTNQAIVRLGSRDELFPVVCRNAVENGGFRFAWIGMIDAANQRVRPVAQYGEDAGYVREVLASADASAAIGHGPLGQALRAGTRVVSNDFLNDPTATPWREAARRAGVGAAAMFPIRERDAVVGAICLYAAETGYFTEDLLATLDEMALDVSFGLTVHAREAERRKSEISLRESEERYRALTDLSSDWYWEQDENLRYTRISRPDAAQREIGEEVFLGRTRREAPGVLWNEPQLAALEALSEVRRPFRDFELSRVYRDGAWSHMQLSGEPVFDAGGRFRGYRGVGRDITQRKHTEVALYESEARFRSLTEMSSDFYWESDAGHRLTARDSANKTLSKISTFQKGAQVGERRWEIPYLSPDAAGWQAHRAVLDAHLPFRGFELSRLGVDGGERHISISGDPVFDASDAFKGYRGVGTDITERKREERLLRLEHAVARSLAEASDQPSALKTVIRSICETNNWGRGTYWRADEVAGVMRFGEHWSMPGPEFERYTEGSRAVVFAPGEGVVGRVWQSGKPLWIADFYNDPRVVQQNLAREVGMRSVIAFPVVAAGKTVGVLAFFSRVAREPDARLLAATRMIGNEVGQFLQRVQAEDQILKLNAELEARVASRTQQLEIANRELEAFSYSVSHDLRAPLRAIHGFSSLLQEQYADRIDEQGRNMLGRVSAGAEKMGQLIDNLLKLSRVSRQEMQIELVDLSEMVWEAIGELQAEAPERKVEWVIAPRVSAAGDPGLLRVVLQNLIGNAWKYSSRRERARIEFGVIESDGRCVYFVRDNGAGFDMKQAKKLFGAFQRLHSTAEFPGSGIGLATVARILHRHGGKAWAEASVGEGASFYFSLD